ncbi:MULTISPECIES: efflux RND transporter periplasmic adaptor subunit [unclassified Roseovarius]|uniref:efflux RND transporter periplasmic adaptor subunit n=1 Tax=unclassified Roseovarius TaxID=2614913 RepID=UPI00273FACF4|nr:MULTISPECIES: efflux RND transporter periplasmic adaptor subunit [unclassified Roseovarius]
MRLLPILVAILVSALIYVFIFQRDALTAGDAPDATVAQENADTGTANESDESADQVGVVAVRSVARAIDSAVVLRGQTEADRQVDLRAETSGQVASTPLRKGAFVEKGQLLCRLDPAAREATLAEAQARLQEARSRIPEAQARLDEAIARLEEARINDNAAARLSEGGFASETRVAATKAAVSAAMAGVETARSGLESTQSGIQSAGAAVAAAETEISRLSIKAPFAGLLESDTAELGSLLQPGDLCATVMQLDPVMLVGFVPETEVNRVELGARAGARLAAGNQVEGNVTFLSRAADPETRTFRVEIEVPNADLTLRDGQTAEIVIAADGTNAHLLPQSALTLNDQGDLGVRIVTGESTAQFIPVTLLRDTMNGVWLGGLPDEADVIIIGQEFVIDGVRVAPTYQEVGQ